MNKWKREGLSYVCTLQYNRGVERWEVKRRLGFVSYHLIKWIHGKTKLYDMAVQEPIIRFSDPSK